MNVGIFLHEPLSFAMSSVPKPAIAAAHTLRLDLSCARRVHTTIVGAAGKGSCLKEMLLRVSLSKFQHERKIVGICPQARKMKTRRNRLTSTLCFV